LRFGFSSDVDADVANAGCGAAALSLDAACETPKPNASRDVAWFDGGLERWGLRSLRDEGGEESSSAIACALCPSPISITATGKTKIECAPSNFSKRLRQDRSERDFFIGAVLLAPIQVVDNACGYGRGIRYVYAGDSVGAGTSTPKVLPGGRSDEQFGSR
jgi:hypothetical protein